MDDRSGHIYFPGRTGEFLSAAAEQQKQNNATGEKQFHEERI
jgi:hypothetical protein